MPDVQVRLRPNGPYIVSGPIEILDTDGNPVEIPDGKTNVALCRCGASTNKPFCDGTHSKIGFDAAKKAVPEAN